jgi:hypothetical protein
MKHDPFLLLECWKAIERWGDVDSAKAASDDLIDKANAIKRWGWIERQRRAKELYDWILNETKGERDGIDADRG